GLSAPPIVTTDQGRYRFTSIAWFNGTLYAGGSIVNARSAFPVNHLYRWNDLNQKWEVLNGAIQTLNYGILDMAVYQNELVVAGLFDQAQGQSVSNITKYNGTNWNFIGTSGSDQGTNGLINDLFIHRNRLYIAGEFNKVGASITGNTAFWTGSLWGGIGNPFTDKTTQLASTGDTLYALGYDAAAPAIKRFTGTGWLKMDSFVDYTRFEPISMEGESGRLWINGFFEKKGTRFRLLSASPDLHIRNFQIPGQINGISIWNKKPHLWGDLKGIGHICAYLPGMGSLNGFVYQETNENRLRDAGEPLLKQRTILLRSGAGEFLSMSNEQGQFSFIVPPGAYELMSVSRKHWEQSCGRVIVNVLEGQEQTQDLALRLIPNHTDLRLKLVPLNPSGMDADRFMRYEVTMENIGSNPVGGATIHFFHDKRLEQFSSQPPASNYMNPEAVWSIPDMAPGTVSRINMRIRVPEGVSNQELLKAWVRTGTLFSSSDLDVSDNMDTIAMAAAGTTSDGNVKSATPESYILPQTDNITYTIHFRNNTDFKTGRFSIVDTIDLNLPVEYLETVAWSHDYRLRVVDGRIAVFTMDPGVLLPSEQSDSLSRGYFSYRIKVKPNLATGTKVYNAAQIAFDVFGKNLTNRTLHVYTNPNIGVNEYEKAIGFRVYPNPASGRIIIENQQGGARDFVLYDVQGRRLIQFHLPAGGRRQIELGGLPNGIYLLQSGNEGVKIMLEGH
ncbi:MAG: T9SS type A sorting domain-containing protein, partial [Bacteroidetes bacterium]|nr:T9SS type A sorting domain-containing protein [Bacteroidota bacterium]